MEKWKKIKEILTLALELDEEERLNYIKKACKGDEKLLEEVLSLLEAHEKSGVLDRSWDSVKLSAISQARVERMKGKIFGNYKIVDELGHGGMGSVYLAERIDGQFDQQVALKILHSGITTDSQVQRFMAERQILASLNHSNIATLLDGGVSEDGQLWFAMEYVDGLPIDKYCDNHRLTIKERLNLFIDVCEAVQFAHGKLVVHRDLKPTNIFVKENGEVKLLDFGIAKALNTDENQDQFSITRRGLLPLTPTYASPEQVLDKDVTVASDIYQLGVILYELLVGTPPYDLRGCSPGEIEGIICRENPDRLSLTVKKVQTAESYKGNTPDKISFTRRTSPGQLRKKLRGELERIIFKAMHKDHGRRYDSADQLAADIQLYLSGRPIMAHPDSRRYRAGKFIKRHKIGFVSAVTILFLLIGYAGTITWHSQQTQAALDQAQTEREKSDHMLNFLVSMFEQATPFGAEGNNTTYDDTLTTVELLNRGSERVRSEFADRPEVQAKMMYKLGRIYRLLGQYDKAEPLLKDALNIQQNTPMANELDIAENKYELARLYRHRGELERPNILYHEVLKTQQKILGEEHREIAETLYELGIIAAREGVYSRSDSLFRRALDMNISVHGKNHPDVAKGMNLLGLLHLLNDELAEAENLFRESYSILTNNKHSDQPNLASTLDRLGQVLVMKGQIDEAENYLLEALEIRENLFQKTHPARAISLNNIGRLYRKKGEYEKADHVFREAQEIYQDMYGPENMDAASTLMERARVYKAKGSFSEAEQFFRQAIHMQRSLHGIDNLYTQQYLHELTELYSDWGYNEKRDSLEIYLSESGNW